MKKHKPFNDRTIRHYCSGCRAVIKQDKPLYRWVTIRGDRVVRGFHSGDCIIRARETMHVEEEPCDAGGQYVRRESAVGIGEAMPNLS